MKRRNQMLLLLGILAGLCVAILLVKGVQKHIDTISTTSEEIVAADPSALTRVSWTKDGTTLTFANADGVWQSTDDATFPVDQEKMADFLAHFESVIASFIIEDVQDFGQYGLDSPEATVTLTAEDGETVIRLGGYSTMDSKRYLTLGDGTVYLIDDDLDEYLTTERDDFMQQDAVPDYDTIDAIQSTGETALSVVYLPDEELTYTDEYDYYQQQDGGYLALATSKVKGFLSTLAGLGYTDYATYNAGQADLADYGLDAPSETITVTTTLDGEQSSFTLSFGQTGEDTCYYRMDDSEIIYKLDADTFREVLDTDADALRPDELVALDWDKVQSLAVTIDGESYEITRTADKDTIGDTEVTLDDLTDAIDALQVSEYLEAAPDKKQEIELEIRCDNDAYPQLRLTLYQYDGENCLAQLDGQTVGLVSRSLAVNLTEAATTLLLGLNADQE